MGRFFKRLFFIKNWKLVYKLTLCFVLVTFISTAFIAYDGDKNIQKKDEEYQAAFSDISKFFDEYAIKVTGIEADHRELVTKYNELVESYLQLKPNSKKYERIITFIPSIQGNLQEESNKITSNITHFKEDSEKTRFYFILLLIGSVLISFIIGFLFSRRISRPIKKLVAISNKLALGDVDVNVGKSSGDEMGQLMAAFSRMVENIKEQASVIERIAGGDFSVKVNVKSENDFLGLKLMELLDKNNEIIRNINVAAEQVSTSAKQLSQSAAEISQGATEQAISIEQLTASLEEVSAQTNLNAQNANNANDLTEKAKQNASKGNEHMLEMLRAMDDINESSTGISKIIKLIDEIAFQTNILALNAAVEAARAGQHGRGFAVVADEVRNLAARSANAAKEITEMIEASIKKVSDGSKIANETAEALIDIVKRITSAAGLINEIAIASNEQAASISQINNGINQISEVIQSNSATSEESAAASEELAGQAQMLKNQVSKFKLKAFHDDEVNSLEDLNPEILKMLDELKPSQSGEVAACLDSADFGKY